jgi:hypothetical protein
MKTFCLAVVLCLLPVIATAPTPAPPTNAVIVSVSAYPSVTIGWTPSTTPGALYYVYRDVSGTSTYFKQNSSPLACTSTTQCLWYDQNVTSGQWYNYLITAVVPGSAESAYSNKLFAPRLPFTSPIGTPAATLTPATLNFLVKLGDRAALSLVLYNSGTGPLLVARPMLSDAVNFSETDNCPAGSGTLPAGQSCTFNIGFYPALAGTYNATFSIADNAAGSPQTVPLQGIAAASGTVAAKKKSHKF